jgi:hypothetical protein
MRFDEINILGDFKINGLTGGENQFIGLSGGDLFWIDSSPNIEGFGVYGTNYIFCNSFTYSATASGESLRNAYASASTLSGISPTNRATIFINPGIYDFDTEPLGLSLSYVDLVGISSVASSVTLVASNAPNTLKYYEGVDSGLYNVGLTGGTTLGVLGSASTYLRWDNVSVSGFAFGDGANYSFENLIGEFRNIHLEDNSVFGVAQSGINGIFDNIRGKTTTQLLYVQGSGNISGTFSNIEINTLGSIFITNGGGILTGDFENIHLNSINFFVNGVVQDARFENIKLNTANNDVFSSELINVDFSNFEVGQSSGEIFLNTAQGTFDNIKIGSTTNRPFFGGGVGTFSNIYIGSCLQAFGGSIGWTGSFRNIEIENFTTAFESVGSITGRFDNIRFGVCTDSTIALFNSSSKLDIEIYGFELSDQDIVTTGTIFGGGIFSGTYKNIKIGNSSGVNVFYSDNSLNGDFSNIEVGDCENLFCVTTIGSGGYLDGRFHNIIAKNVNGDVFTTIGDATLGGTYSDIEIKIENESGTCFHVTDGSLLSGDFYNIKLVNLGDYVFSNIFGDVNVKVKNLTTKNTQGIFNANGNLYGEISNVIVDKIDAAFFTSGGDMDLAVYNFTIRSTNGLPAQAFSSVSSISGTYSNIYIHSNEVGVEYFSSGPISGSYENLYLGTAVSLFNGTINSSTIIKNLNSDSFIFSIFGGKISDSYLNALGTNVPQPAIVLSGGAVVDRCRLLTHSSQNSLEGGSVNVKITYLISNTPISPFMTNLISDNKNIISSAVRSEPKY